MGEEKLDVCERRVRAAAWKLHETKCEKKERKKKLARVLKCERIRFKGERERERKLDLNATDWLFRHEHAVGFRINDLLTNVVYYYEL